MLLLSSDLSGGGAERELANVANGFDPARVEVHVALWRDRRRYHLDPALPVHVLHKRRPWHLPGVVARTRRLLDALDPALVYSVLPFPNLSVALARTGRRGPAWVARVVSDPALDVPPWLAPPLGAALRRADEVHACSAGVARATEARLGLAGVRVYDNPLDLDAVVAASAGEATLPAEAAPILLYAGRLAREKRVDRLFGALARVDAPFVLWVFGEGPEEGALRARAARLGLEARVRFFGFSSALPAAFRRARVLVLTSELEGFPNVLVEAAACGLGAVATDCRHGPAELVEDGVTGRLVPEHDPAALAAALREALGAPDRARAWGEEARRRVGERFGQRRAIRRVVERLSGLAEQARRGG